MLKLGTRGSPLALCQAGLVSEGLSRRWPGLKVVIVPIQTSGDKFLGAVLSQAGGKGLFVKEIEEALLDSRIDLAVHSMKDLPAELAPGLRVGAVTQREDPLDALVAKNGLRFTELSRGARIGTSSLRRQVQLLHRRQDLQIVPLRGNVGTRLKKLETLDIEAVVLAAAGLIRLGLQDRITECRAYRQICACRRSARERWRSKSGRTISEWPSLSRRSIIVRLDRPRWRSGLFCGAWAGAA